MDDEEVPIGSTDLERTPAPVTPAAAPPPSTIDTSQLADIQERRMGATRAIQGKTLGRMEQDRQRAEQALDATGIGPDELQKWDHERMSERYRTDPIEAFGSLGSVFAMVASAFSGAPMENALNAGAAAMNAVRAGDDREFDRAFKAWQSNTDLAIKRHNIQQAYYSNSMKMMETNMAAGRAEMEMAAVRFGDERTLFLLRNGLDKEALELQVKREDAMRKMEENRTAITENRIRTDIWDKSAAEIDQMQQAGEMTPEQAAGHKLALWNRVFQKMGTPSQEAFGLLLHEMRGKPATEIIEEAQKRGVLPRASGVLTRDRMGAEEITRRMTQYEKDNIAAGMSPEDAKREAFQRATREVDTEMARMTGGQLSTLEGQSDAYNYSMQTIDRLVPKLKSLLGPVGTPGYIQRGREILGNLLGGTNSTEYQQVAKEIALLKTWASRNLLGRDGRPLSAEHGNIDRVITGLSLTDTAQNTIKSFEELRKLYNQMQADVERRRTRTRPAGGAAAPAEPAAPGGSAPRRPSWSDAPLVAQ